MQWRPVGAKIYSTLTRHILALQTKMGLFGIASFQKPSQATNANPILLSPCLYLPSRFALPLLCLFPPAPSL